MYLGDAGWSIPRRCDAMRWKQVWSTFPPKTENDYAQKSACIKGGHTGESRSTHAHTIFEHSFIRGWINLSKSPAHIGGASIKYKSLSLIYCSLAAFDMLNGSQISGRSWIRRRRRRRSLPVCKMHVQHEHEEPSEIRGHTLNCCTQGGKKMPLGVRGMGGCRGGGLHCTHLSSILTQNDRNYLISI